MGKGRGGGKNQRDMGSIPGLDALAMIAGGRAAEGTSFQEQVETSTIPIDRILIDPAQPRRSMPEELRVRWLQGELVLQDWLDQAMIADQLVVALWRNLLHGEAIEDQTEPRSPVGMQWMELVRLAASIHRAGLEQPVAVYQDVRDYRLIFGERRLLAFHLLRWVGFADYDEIPAQVRERDDLAVWRQAFENSVRQDLNAIGKARQLALLLMAVNNQLATPEEQPGWDWYAQAANLRLPYGQAGDIMTVLGFGDSAQVTRYRQLLGLPAEAARIADEYNFTEGKMRALIAKTTDSFQLARIFRIEAGLESAPPVARDDRLVRKAEQVRKNLLAWKDDDLAALPSQDRKALIVETRAFLKRLEGK